MTDRERGECPECGRSVALRALRGGGDWVDQVLYRHLNRTGLRCAGTGGKPVPAVDYSWADDSPPGPGEGDATAAAVAAEDRAASPLDALVYAMGEAQAALEQVQAALQPALDALDLQDTRVVVLVDWAQAQRRVLREVEATATLYAGQNLQVPRDGELPDGRRYTLRRGANRKAWNHDAWQHDARQAVIREAVPADAEVIDPATGEAESARRMAQRVAAAVEAVHGSSPPRLGALRRLGLDPDEYAETTPGPWGIEFADPTTTTED